MDKHALTQAGACGTCSKAEHQPKFHEALDLSSLKAIGLPSKVSLGDGYEEYQQYYQCPICGRVYCHLAEVKYLEHGQDNRRVRVVSVTVNR